MPEVEEVEYDIDPKDLRVDIYHASGAGGQNVNKLSTAAQLRFDVSRASLAPDVMMRLTTLAGQRMTKDGVIVIHAQRFRTQERNRADAIERLVELLRAATIRPKPRRATKPTLGSKLRRLDQPFQHTKMVLVDGKRGWVGSQNFSSNALENNRELGVFLTDPAILRRLDAVLRAK